MQPTNVVRTGYVWRPSLDKVYVGVIHNVTLQQNIVTRVFVTVSIDLCNSVLLPTIVLMSQTEVLVPRLCVKVEGVQRLHWENAGTADNAEG